MNTPKQTKKQDYMIDTVAIKITFPDFEVLKPELFSPALIIKTAKDIPTNFDYKKLWQKYTQNATDENGQTTKLTAYRRFEDGNLNYHLHAEASIPNMIFGNNLQEPGNTDFEPAVALLHKRLSNMGIETTKEIIKKAQITKVHFGKNIPLPNPKTSRDAIIELQKGDLGKSFDVDHREYKNTGEALYFYTTPRNLIFYDKVKDLQKPKNKSADKEKTGQEKDFIAYGLLKGKEILRFEIRLVGQVSVNRFISKATKEKVEKINFETVFNQELCKKVILYSWKDIIGKPANQLAFKLAVSPEDALNALIEREREQKESVHTLNRVLISFGLYQLINKFGIQYVRNKLETVWSEKTCGTRLDKKIRESAISLQDIPNATIISFIDESLQEFERYTLNY